MIAVFLNAESILLIFHQSPCVARLVCWIVERCIFLMGILCFRLTGKYCKIVSAALPVSFLVHIVSEVAIDM